MNKLKIKVITGFREDQYQTLDADEAHKAYYLFLNPDERAVFKNGVALIGKNIQAIEPDYHATMGWNATHRLDSDDWNDLNTKGISDKLRKILFEAKNIAYQIDTDPMLMTKTITEIMPKLLN